jgi:hypothetical protein
MQMFIVAFAYVMLSSDKIYYMWWCKLFYNIAACSLYEFTWIGL